MRPSLDDFPLTQHLALAAMGEMSSEATHPSVTTAGMTREVRVAHCKFPDGGLVIPSLPDLRKTAHAQIVRTASCWRCVDLMCRCKQRDNGPRIERLEKRLYRGAPRAFIERSQVQSPARQPARETRVVERRGARQIPRKADRGCAWRTWELTPHERRCTREVFEWRGHAPKCLTITRLSTLVRPRRYCS
jgi:hypothetical protein